MNNKRKTILVVDDSPVMQKMTEKFFRNNHYEVYSALSGQECLQMTEKYRPDAILMDVILPDADGRSIAEKLKDDPKTEKTAIIFTTNTVSLKEDKGFESFEINGVIYRAFAKPLHYPKILNVVKKEINRVLQGGELSPRIKERKKPV